MRNGVLRSELFLLIGIIVGVIGRARIINAQASSSLRQEISDHEYLESCAQGVKLSDMDSETLLTFIECASKMTQIKDLVPVSKSGEVGNARFDGFGVLGSEVSEMRVDELTEVLGLHPNLAECIASFAEHSIPSDARPSDRADGRFPGHEQCEGVCDDRDGLFWSPETEEASRRSQVHELLSPSPFLKEHPTGPACTNES
jgi:hypothetical protein